MKPSDGKFTTVPFFSSNGLSITTLNEGGKILGWCVKNGKVKKEFKVKGGKILATWKKLELYLNKLWATKNAFIWFTRTAEATTKKFSMSARERTKDF